MRLLVILALCTLFACNKNQINKVTSPNGKIELELSVDNGNIYYDVSSNGKKILDKSLLGLDLKDTEFKGDFEVKDIRFSSFNDTWDQPWGEEITVENSYNEMKVDIEETSNLKRQMTIVFRLFDDGFGFRYEIPEQTNLKDVVIMDELTEFNFVDDHQAWSLPYNTEFYEGIYDKKPISQLDTVATPITVETKDGLFLAVHEANLTDYAAINFTPENHTTKLKAYLTPWSTGEKVFQTAPFVTPWRTMIIADNAGDLLLSRLMLNLNEPSRIKDTSWIKPGKYIGIWWAIHMKDYTWEQGNKHGATTENTKRYIDFAAKHNIDGVLVEGWNKGWEDWKSFDVLTPYDDFDIEEINRYGKSKNVSLIGHHETGGNTKKYESQMDSAYVYYKKNGVDIVKTGYVGSKLDGKELHGSQYAVRHYRKVIETAAQNQIMIDNHEPVMPTGLQRTYPNLMTQEGVRGQEWNAWAKDGGNPPEHTTIIPFTRGLAGPMDFTPTIFKFENPANPETKVRSTLAKQLAEFVVLYSPLQMAADKIENYEENLDAFAFIESCPTDWSKTLVPHAKIGEYVTIARKAKKTDNWYIGSITNSEARELVLDLSFLDANSQYKATIYQDGKDANYVSNPYPIDIETIEVNKDSNIILKLAPGGGTAISIEKI